MSTLAKILVLDDEEDTSDLFSQMFRNQIEANEYEFSFSSSFDDALNKLKNDAYDIFISDINVNGEDCLGLIGQLRKDYPLMRSIVISAYGDINTLRAVMRGGAHDFVIKPIDFKDLMSTVAKTVVVVTKLKENKEAAQRLSAINDELDISATLQKSILPPNCLRQGNIDLYANSIPAAEVGGDFYDYFWINKTKLGIVIADVSGKNISGAMFMTMASTLVKSCSRMSDSPAECFRHVNEIICMQNVTTRFVTAMYGIIDTENHTLTYTNAGHLPIALLRPNCEPEFLECDPGIALGIYDEAVFVDHVQPLSLGDMFMMYTDGVTEAADPVGGEYEYERFTKVLSDNKKAIPRLLTDAVIESIRKYADGAPQSDDITTLCVKYKIRISQNVT